MKKTKSQSQSQSAIATAGARPGSQIGGTDWNRRSRGGFGGERGISLLSWGWESSEREGIRAFRAGMQGFGSTMRFVSALI